MNIFESYAEYYHEQTKYTPEGVASNKHVLDFNKQPDVFKTYEGSKEIDLSYLLPLDRNPFSDRGIKSPDSFTAEEKSLCRVSKLLYFTNGITAVIPNPDRPFYMRAAPSAGGLYPTEIYVCSSGYEGLEDGIYNYQINKQSLVMVSSGNYKKQLQEASFENKVVDNCNLFLIVTGVFQRSSWRYQDRAYRRICLDTGHALGNISIIDSYCGFNAVHLGGFIDDEINSLLKLEDEEQSLVLVALQNKKNNSIEEKDLALPSKMDNFKAQTKEGTRLVELHNRSKIEKYIKIPATSKSSIEDNFKLSPKIDLKNSTFKGKWKSELIDTIIKRRSTRSFSGESISKDQLGEILNFTYSPGMYSSENLNPSPTFFDKSLINTFIGVNAVSDLDEGCYYYSESGKYLRQVRFKNLCDEIYYLSLGQDLAKDASAVVFHTCKLSDAVYKYGERAYRYLHLDAGHMGQRMNLAAVNLNLGASGIGGFFDDQVNELLGIPEEEAVIYITVLGVPKEH